MLVIQVWGIYGTEFCQYIERVCFGRKYLVTSGVRNRCMRTTCIQDVVWAGSQDFISRCRMMRIAASQHYRKWQVTNFFKPVQSWQCVRKWVDYKVPTTDLGH